MSALVEKAKQDRRRFSLAAESDDPSSPPVERTQPKKKRQTKKTSIIRPPRRRIATTQQPASAEGSNQTQPAVPLPVPTSSTPVAIRGPNPTAPTPPLVSPFTPARPTHSSSHLGPVMSALAAIGSSVTSIQKNLDTMNRKNDTVLRRLTDLEVMCTRLARQQDQILAGQHRPTIPAAVVDDQQVPAIPDLYNIPNEELTRIKVSAKSSGNFAAALTKRFFPELYGMDNLRYFYNWNGGGKHGKRELDPARREIIRQFTVRMYPEVRQEDIFRTNVINAVNEMLRRQPKKQRPALAAVQIENNPPEADTHYQELDFNAL
ncbi:Hypothetical predicted protein [Mytilus galloprovincialis]|uniref:BEN domain-containing protein n=2 Tax=Mytilus galloprovincialis TaxID=29158 RepID=A0A8B6BF44_MYTGA|nr:Hypothetical predicted protein [Mytilus galloprovincialis]